MSVCIFLAADFPLKEREADYYPVTIDLGKGIIDDGDDNQYSLFDFKDVEYYCDKEYGVYLEWRYTEGRALNLIDYIKQTLNDGEVIELWSVWLMDYYEYTQRPKIQRKDISIHELTIEDIKEIDDARHWKSSDDERPTYYCLEITK